MIIPTYTEDEVLKELQEDWPEMKRKAKKLGKQLMNGMPKWCVGMPKEHAYYLHEKYRSKNGNTWGVGVFTQTGWNYWQSVLTCEVETKYRTKSYFFLRGLERNKPYYVEVTSHAMRRMRERAKNIYGEYFFVDKPVGFLCDFAIFDRGELGVFLKKGTLDGDGNFVPMLDHEGNTYGKVWLHNSLFYARATTRGNYVFKTFINPPTKDEEGTHKYEFASLHFGIWLLLNCTRTKYSMAKEFRKLTEEQRINVVLETCPRMYKKIMKIGDALLVLEP